MKIAFFFLALTLSMASFAQELRIQLVMHPSHVDLRIQNFTGDDLLCQGPILLQTRRRRETHFMSKLIPAGTLSSRRVFPSQYREGILNARHAVRCAPAK